MTGDGQERAQAGARPSGHSLVLAAAALTVLAAALVVALSAGAGQTVERETAPLEPPSREESGVETDPPGGQPPDESAALRPARVVRSGVLVGLPVVVVAFAAVARRRRRAVAARGAATVTLALWTPLFAASVGPLFLLAAALSGVATGLAVADRRPDGAARPG